VFSGKNAIGKNIAEKTSYLPKAGLQLIASNSKECLSPISEHMFFKKLVISLSKSLTLRCFV